MVTSATRARLQRVHDNAGILVLLMLEHPSITTIHVVNDTRNWTIGSTTWVGLPFRFQLPNETAGQSAAARIEIDNVGSALSEDLDALPPGAALQATFRLVSRATPDQIDYEFGAPLSGVDITTTLVQATVGTDDEDRMPAVMLRFDTTTAPGLFEG